MTEDNEGTQWMCQTQALTKLSRMKCDQVQDELTLCTTLIITADGVCRGEAGVGDIAKPQGSKGSLTKNKSYCFSVDQTYWLEFLIPWSGICAKLKHQKQWVRKRIEASDYTGY